MLIVTVHHLRINDLSRDQMAALQDWKTPPDITEYLPLYTPVATVTCNTTSIVQALRIAFDSTNHIDCDWYENDNVTMLIPTPYQARSSMVGDIFEVNGRHHMVRSVGYDPKPPSDDAPALPKPHDPTATMPMLSSTKSPRSQHGA